MQTAILTKDIELDFHPLMGYTLAKGLTFLFFDDGMGYFEVDEVEHGIELQEGEYEIVDTKDAK